MRKNLSLAILFASVIAGAVFFGPLQTVFADAGGAGAKTAAEIAAEAAKPPDLAAFGNLLTFISQYIRILGYSLAVIAFIYAGFLYFTAYGDESKPTRAKQVFIAVIVGLVLIISSEIIIHATLNTVAAPTTITLPSSSEKGNVNIAPTVNGLVPK